MQIFILQLPLLTSFSILFKQTELALKQILNPGQAAGVPTTGRRAASPLETAGQDIGRSWIRVQSMPN